MSQSDLADALSVSFQQIQKYERGANRISASMLIRAAAALGEPITALIPGAGSSASGTSGRGSTREFAPVGRGLKDAYAALSDRNRRLVMNLAVALAEGATRSAGVETPSASETASAPDLSST
jgi:transcriptional regulator with XRE-family HTH domain